MVPDPKILMCFPSTPGHCLQALLPLDVLEQHQHHQGLPGHVLVVAVVCNPMVDKWWVEHWNTNNIRGSRWQIRTYSLVSKNPERPDFRMSCHTILCVFWKYHIVQNIAPHCRERLLQHSITETNQLCSCIALARKCRGKYTQTGWDQYTPPPLPPLNIHPSTLHQTSLI